ncbi:MAG: inosine-5-monophosphate dehydrogenase [Candidatus Peribacteria bacterium]|nr:inosine-5-monophosphate dehydrogenase [Candidatus Peribacteria bacterium]
MCILLFLKIMARAGNFEVLKPPCPLPDFPTLAFDEQNEFRWGGEEMEPTEVFRAALETREKCREALFKKMQALSQQGRIAPEELQQSLTAERAWYKSKWDIIASDETIYTKSVSRGEFSVKPYEVQGKNTLDHPFPGFSAAMDAQWPGYEESYRNFLKKHNADKWFPERIASLGAVFVPHPDASGGENRELLEHMRRQHKYFRNVPTVTKYTTAGDVKSLLSHYDTDFPVAVVDSGGKLQRFLSLKDVGNAKDLTTVSDIKSTGDYGMSAPSEDIKPEDAFALLEKTGKDFMYREFDENIIRVMSLTTAALSKLLPPFTFREGLGSIVYLGINDYEGAIKKLKSYTKFGIAGAIIETAHADRDDVIHFVRRVRARFPDLFLAAGTVTDPFAVSELLEEVDAVKVGIAEGSSCRTSETGVGITNAWAGFVCGQAAYGKGTIILDGWGGGLNGSTQEFCVGMSFHSVRGRQGGGAFSNRAESAMPLGPNKDDPQEMRQGKNVRGMASKSADIYRQKQRGGVDARKRMALQIEPYWEGAEEWRPLRSPRTVAGLMLLSKQRLQSAMSYAGVRSSDKSPHLQQFHEQAELFMVPKKNGN